MGAAMMEMQAVPFPEVGEAVYAGQQGGQVYVAVKPICERLGIDWEAQRQKVRAHPVLSKGALIIAVPSAGGTQQTLCLPLELLPGWLFTINVNKVAASLRDKLLAYQILCFKVLHEYFLGTVPAAGGAASLPPAAEMLPAEPEESCADMDALLSDGERLGRALAIVREARMVWPRDWVRQVWRDVGLPVPPETQEALAQDAGSLVAFLDEQVEPAPGQRLRFGVLQRRYYSWCRERRVPPVTTHVMGRVLATRFVRGNSNGRYYSDVRLAA